MAGILHTGRLAPHMELARATFVDKPIYVLASNNDGSILVYCPGTKTTWTLAISELIKMALEDGLVGELPAKDPEDPEVQDPEPKDAE